MPDDGRTMNFFEHQAQARTRTTWLVLLFALAVAGIMLALYAAAAFGLSLAETGTAPDGTPVPPAPFWRPELAGGIALLVLGIVGIGSLVKISQLASGGGAVARMLGGREIPPDTRDPAERRLRNVVEEMAIAAGLPVPAVYVLDDEPGMNAFAAGRRPGDAAVAVTRGLLERLSRDELQGVVAHEFSHILNGDMSLNLRLMGVIYGILVISIMGRMIMQAARFSGGSSRRSRGGGQAGLVLLLGGLATFLIGYIGVFFGRLIQAAVSRQREHLADASAVQFTRHPDGLAGALKRLGAASLHGRIQHPRAQEASHLFFADGVSAWTSLFATHPPLVERIRRIDPSFDGDFSPWAGPARDREPTARPVRGDAHPPPPVPSAAAAAVAALQSASPFTERIGRVAPEALSYAREFRSALPSALQNALSDPESATAAVLALLLSEDDEAIAGRQTGLIRDRLGGPLAEQVRALRPATGLLGGADRLPFAELAVDTLRHMNPEAYPVFRALVVELARLDGRISLFEYAFMRVVVHRLDGVLDPTGQERGTGRLRLTRLGGEGAAVLGALARLGGDTPAAAEAAFEAGRDRLEGCGDWSLPPPDATRLQDVDAALARLVHLAPMDKAAFVDACAACVFHDGEVRVHEAELLRAVAALLDCPTPPLPRSGGGPA